MTKEQQIEEMTDKFIEAGCYNNLIILLGFDNPNARIYECCRETAEIAINAGYGNINEAVNQALTEFVSKLKERAVGIIVPLCDSAVPMVTIKDAEKLLKEFLGGEE